MRSTMYIQLYRDTRCGHGFWYVGSSCRGGGGGTCVRGHPGIVGFPPTSPFSTFLTSSPMYPTGDAGAGAGECLGAQIMCNITATSIYAPVDHNTNGNTFVTESVLSPHLSGKCLSISFTTCSMHVTLFYYIHL